MNIMKSGDRDKKLSIKQYLYIVITYLAELINKKNNNNELKIKYGRKFYVYY